MHKPVNEISTIYLIQSVKNLNSSHNPWSFKLRSTILFGAALCCAFSTAPSAEEFTAEFFLQEAARTVAPAYRANPGKALRGAARPAIAAANGNSALASWYGGGEKLARHTASGEVFQPNGLTAAHRTLPLGTRLVVSSNGHSVTVRVNDRGPAKYTGRSLDLSRGAAKALGMIGKGTARVSWRVA